MKNIQKRKIKNFNNIFLFLKKVNTIVNFSPNAHAQCNFSSNKYTIPYFGGHTVAERK